MMGDDAAREAYLLQRGPKPGYEDWRCGRCGCHRWVDWAAGVNMPRRAQCVPCGHVQDLPAAVPVHGMCTACGSVEVALVKASGTRDLSAMGESAEYPTGYGCEVCS